MITSFKSAEAQSVFHGGRGKNLPADIQNVAFRKLGYVDSAEKLDDLRVPPGNQLEALKGDRKGQHSIRINGQWRVCFVWQAADEEQGIAAGARDVEIVDYH